MLPAADDAHEQLPRLPFTPADYAAADAFLQRVRVDGVAVRVVTDHEECPEALEVFRPWNPEADYRWTGFRDARGAWVDDLDTGERYGPGTMSEVLAVIEEALAEERAEVLRHIPVALLPPAGSLGRWGGG